MTPMGVPSTSCFVHPWSALVNPVILTSDLPAHRALDVLTFEASTMLPAHRGRVTHGHGSLVFYDGGEGVMWVRGVKYTLRARGILLIPEGCPHYLIHQQGLRGVGVRVCQGCGGGRWFRVLDQLFEHVRQGAHASRECSPRAWPKLLAHLHALRDTLHAAHPLTLEQEGLLSLIVSQVTLAAEDATAGRAPSHSLAGRALTHIEAHAIEGISLHDVARAVGRTPSHVASVVKQETGSTVGAWIERVRMAHARRLLMGCDETIEVVADRVGFESLSHFHRTFRRAHGMAPGAWRRSHGEG